MFSTGIKLLQFFRFQKLSQNLKVQFFASRGFRLERVLPREDFASRGFLPREVFTLERILSLEKILAERIFPEQIQNLTCRFLVVNQVHYKDPSMVLDRERESLRATGRD